MRSKILGIVLIAILVLSIIPAYSALALTFEFGKPAEPTFLTSETKQCVSCHQYVTNFIVEDWKRSKHYMVGTGCYECHKADPTDVDAYEHYGFTISFLVTPKDCGRCHAAIYEESQKAIHFYAGKHAYKLAEYPAFWRIITDILGITFPEENPEHPLFKNMKVPEDYVKNVWITEGGKWTEEIAKFGVTGEDVLKKDPALQYTYGLTPAGLSPDNLDVCKLCFIWSAKGCLTCHGAIMKAWMVEVGGKKLYDPVVVHNHGVGRDNPDGSVGSCEACHPYHSFSTKIARKGAYQTCGRCHTGYDHPNDEQWKKSMHGAIFLGEADDWNWDAKRMRPGIDFRAPTCTTCHMAAVYDTSGSRILYPLSHDVAIICKWKLGRWVVSFPRIAGMIDTAIPELGVVYPEPNWDVRRQRCIDMCAQCHTKYFAASHLLDADYGIILLDYVRDVIFNPVEKMLKEKGIWRPTDKIDFRMLRSGEAGNRPAKMALFHFAPDFVWWEGIVMNIWEGTKLMIEIAERPEVKAKAPEIVEFLKEAYPWFKEIEEAATESTGSLSPVTFKEILKKYAESPEVNVEVRPPLVEAVKVKSNVTVSEAPSIPLPILFIIPLAVLLPVIAFRRR